MLLALVAVLGVGALILSGLDGEGDVRGAGEALGSGRILGADRVTRCRVLTV